MKLSQAIALGSTIVKAGQYHDYTDNSARTTGCGLEMALEAVGSSIHWTLAAQVWPWLGGDADGYRCEWLPVVGSQFDVNVLEKGQSLDSFIDWVASIEPPETCSECRSEQPVNEIQACQECQR